jgi:hypothetical protein
VRWFRRESEPSGADRLPEPRADDDVTALLVALTDLDRYINRSAGRLPTAAWVKARWVVDTLREILKTSETRPLEVHALLTVHGTVRDYLPTTLKSYFALDDDAHAISAVSGHASAHLLTDQLQTLQEAATSTLTAVRTQDADALSAQGAFLRTKFSRSDLDL